MKESCGRFTVARKVKLETRGLLAWHSQLSSCRMSGLVAGWILTAGMGLKSEPNSKCCLTWKEFISECYDLHVSVFSCKIGAKKKGRMFTLHQASVSLQCSPFQRTAKAPRIIKDWFKRPFYNLSKHWAWLMLHIISSCHLLLLRMFTVSLTPPQH